MVVISAGTGGTVAGIGRKLKEKLPNIKVNQPTPADTFIHANLFFVCFFGFAFSRLGSYRRLLVSILSDPSLPSPSPSMKLTSPRTK